MSQEEVEALIGLPPGDYFTGPRGIGGAMSRGPFGFQLEERGLPSDKLPATWRRKSTIGGKQGTVRSWWGNDYAIQVAFDETNEAVGWYLLEVVSAVEEPSLIHRLRIWLGW
jgi:hypothetical protein